MASRSLGNLTVNMVMNTGSFTQGAGRAEAAVERLNKSARRQRDELSRLVAQIDPVVAEYDRIDKMEEKLRKHRKAGTIGQDDYDVYLGKLKEMRDSVGKTSIEFGKNGKSAKEMAFAMRGLPAQFTDIAVSLQGGQRPMTVLLQQGGQIKDMFGGIGPAARAMGGYILGLVNPFTVAASAAGVFALAYYQASEEIARYQNALVLSGNVSGTTSDALKEQAKQLGSLSGSYRASAKAVAEVASTGKFTSEQILMVSSAAVSMQDATGKAVSDTIAEFSKLADEPGKFILELDKSQNFLTASVYEQITALKTQGKEQEAVSLALKTYADTIEKRTNEIVPKLGHIEEAWKAIKKATAGAWQAVKEYGSEDSETEKLQKLNDRLEQLKTTQKTYQTLVNAGLKTSGDGTFEINYEKEIKNIDNKINAINDEKSALEASIATKKESAEAEAKIQKIEREGKSAIEKLNKLREEGLSIEEKKAKEIKAYWSWIEAIKQSTPDSPSLNQAQIDKDLAYIESKYKKAQKAIQQMLMRLREQEATLNEQLNTNTKLSSSQQQLVKFEQQLADLKEKKTLTAQQKSLIAEEDIIREQLKKNIAIESELSLRKQAIRIQNMQASTAAQLANDIQNYQNSLANYGAGEEALKRLREEQAIRNYIAKQIERATASNLAGKISNDELDAQKRILEKALDERLSAHRNYYEQLDGLESDWKNGAKAAFDDYIREAQRTAKITQGFFSSAFKSMENSIYQFAVNGKASFRDFANAILQDMARIASQQAAAGLLSAGVSLFSGAATAGAPVTGLNNGYGSGVIGQVTFSDGGYTGAGGKYVPAGIVHRGEVVWSQGDVARAGGVGIVEAMRKGVLNYKEGLKGYASGGAVGLNMPAITSSGSPSVVIHQEINVADSQASNGASVDQQSIAKAYADSAKMGAREEIAKQLRPGGLIWRAQNGR
ncbi:phage tail tape measure protein [Vibrio cincinnatiensis]|uniref:phage tail tape measure protein n=1 Tax=Vibrio cincinnatiensis TaxID=675 RepID=UPI001EE149E6|nr:phage tail tape measure protein [Vibrio cincinnatiensis]MCG3743082.1 phage tail tape measure protein [Vibrio cincinnatiensis]